MVGDTEYDMQMAHHAGIDGLGISYGAHTEARLIEARALHVVKDFSELLEWALPRVIPAYGDDA